MNLVIGILLFVLGLFALFAWSGELLPFFKGLLVCSLLLWGVAAMIVGVAKARARRHLARAKADKPSAAESNAD